MTMNSDVGAYQWLQDMVGHFRVWASAACPAVEFGRMLEKYVCVFLSVETVESAVGRAWVDMGFLRVSTARCY